MEVDPNRLDHPLNRVNEADVASHMIEENHLPTGAEDTFHLCHGFAIVGYAAQGESANDGVKAAVREGEGLGITDLEIDLPTEIVRALARNLKHGRAQIDARQPDRGGIEGEVAASTDGNLQRLAHGQRAGPLSVVGKEDLLEEANLFIVLWGEVIPIRAKTLDVVHRVPLGCARAGSRHEVSLTGPPN